MKNEKPSDITSLYSNFMEVGLNAEAGTVRLTFAEGLEGPQKPMNWHSSVTMTVANARHLHEILDKMLPAKEVPPLKH